MHLYATRRERGDLNASGRWCEVGALVLFPEKGIL